MPVISSQYKSPRWLKGGHIQTIVPTLFRKVPTQGIIRERIATSDGDFLDLDWSRTGSKKLVVLSHGLEGCSRQAYMLGMARALNQAGWDTLCWNFRGCSGQLNNKVYFYHAGATNDLQRVVQHVRTSQAYSQIAFVGFSLGGCLTLKMLGEMGNHYPSEFSHAIVFSVPCDLKEGVKALSATPFHDIIYQRRFLKSLKDKVMQKTILYPDFLSHIRINEIHTLKDFDEVFTAPLHGFKNAQDYYEKCSCLSILPEIRLPTLIVNSINDPLLIAETNPLKHCKEHKYIHLELPDEGGHVGFVHTNLKNQFWSETRVIHYLSS